jgi:hypothetical protein
MGRILVDGEPGNDLVPELAALPGETVIVKPGKGAFYATPLGDLLQRQGIGHLVFAGVTTEVCVQTTMREANDRGYECLLAEDATESYFPEFKAATLAMIRAQGHRRLDGADPPSSPRSLGCRHGRGFRRLRSGPGRALRRSCRATDDLAFVAKDLIDVAGQVTGGGNPHWHQRQTPATRSAPVIERLLRAGAALVGKTITDELAFSLEGENAHYGTPINPRAPDRLPGGSSSGSAVAVAAGLADLGLGTDTGGSVRVPASFCGLFGWRPSHGRVPMDGVVPFAPSFDTVGLFAREAGHLRLAAHCLLETPPRRCDLAGCCSTPSLGRTRQLQRLRRGAKLGDRRVYISPAGRTISSKPMAFCRDSRSRARWALFSILVHASAQPSSRGSTVCVPSILPVARAGGLGAPRRRGDCARCCRREPCCCCRPRPPSHRSASCATKPPVVSTRRR